MKVKTLFISAVISITALAFFSSNSANATTQLHSSGKASAIASITPSLPIQDYARFFSSGVNAYVPTCIPSGSSLGSISGSCGGEITSEGNIERTKEMVEKYGVLAMNLQIAYGVSWELIITQMVAESGVGTAGTAVQQSADGLYNWMGLSTYNINGVAKYGTGKTYARPANEGAYYESFATIDDMMKAYASGDYLRNGLYDAAFAYTDKDNYNLLEYDRIICGMYVQGSSEPCSEDDEYVTTTMGYLKYVREKAAELGYPTTEELQKQQNIPIGGKFAIGSSDVYDDSISCSGSTTSTTNSSNNSSSSTNNSTSSTSSTSTSSTTSSSNDAGCKKLAELRQALWNAASDEDKELFMGVAYRENGGIALEGFFNQIVGYKISSIHDWLNNQCVAFGGGMSCTDRKHSLTEEGADEALKAALGGSNKLRFAIGNATGGSGVRAGKITCVWDGEKCRDDVNYDQPSGTPCSSFTPNELDECWGTEGAPDWAEENGVSSCTNGGNVPISSNSNSTNTCETTSSNCYESVSEGDFPNYYQGDPQWANESTGNSSCSTIGPCGCGATSYAEIITALTGQSVTPVDVANMTSSTPYWQTSGDGMVEIDKQVASQYGLEVKGVDFGDSSDLVSKIKSTLEDGWLIHLSGNVGDWGGLSSGSGHYVSVLAIRSNGGQDEVLVTSFNNLHGESYYGGNHWVPLEAMGHLGIYENSSFSATRKTGSSGSSGSSNSSSGSASTKSVSCGSTNVDCSQIKGSSIGQNGLSEELAALFLARYQANENGLTEQLLGDYWTATSGNGRPKKNQCTTLAQFFVNNFTKQTLGACSGGSCTSPSSFSGGEVIDGSADPPVFSIFDSSGHVGIIVGKDSSGNTITMNNNGMSYDESQVGNSNAVNEIMTNGKVDPAKASKYYDWEFGGGWSDNVGVVSHSSGTGAYYSFGKLDVDTDKLIKYLCTGQL